MTNTQVEQVYTEVLTTGVSSGVVEQVYTEVVGTNVQAPTALVEDYAQVAYGSTAPATVALLEDYAQVAHTLPGLPAATEYPSTLTNRELWWRSKDHYGGNGTLIQSWPDRSGLGRDGVRFGSQPTLSTGATPNGGSAVTFAGANGLLVDGFMSIGDVAGPICSSQLLGNEPVWYAFDGNSARKWTTNGTTTGYLGLRLRTAMVVTEYAVTGANSTQSPSAWTFQGSPDGLTWTTLDTRSAVTFSGLTPITYSFSNSTAYKFYRMNITANAGNSTFLSVTQLSLTGVTYSPFTGSAEIWVVVDATAGTGTANGLWSMNNDTVSNAHSFYPYSAGANVYDPFGVAAANTAHFATATYPVNRWRLYRVTNDGTNLRVYLDNALVSTLTVASQGGLDWPASARIGATLGGASTWHFTGKIAEVFARSTISSASEILNLTTHFNTEHGLGLPTVPAGTVLARYRAINSSGVGTSPLAIADESGNGFDATLTTATVVSIAPFTIVGSTDSAHYGPFGPDGGADLAIDGNAGTYYTSNATASGWLRFQLNLATAVTSYAIRRRDDIPARNPTAWTLEGSNNGTSFTVLDTRSGVTWLVAGATNTYSFSNSTAYLYYRLNVTANGGDTYLSVAEISLSGGASNKAIRLSGGVWTILKSDFAVNTGSVSSTFASGADGTWTGLIDGNLGSFWTTAGTQTGFVILQLPVARAATVYTVTARNDGLASTRSPKDWTFAGSNDGSTWTTLDTRTAETGWTTSLSRSYTFTNTVAYAHYRLNVTANNGDTYLSFSGLTMGYIPTIWPSTTEREMWLVVKSNSVGTQSWVLGTSGAASIYPYTDNNIYDDSFITQRQQFLPTMSINVLRLYRVTFTGGAWTAYLDGVSQLAVTSKSAGENSNPRMGSAASIDYVEVLIRQQVSTPSEAADYITYFNNTYGLAVPGGSTPSTIGSGYGALPV